ncbi:putative integral membrane protein [Mycolicibacterium chubuense NBB4]|uniref:Putative integral membrane protein n=1 Tax=Mycolicibacterium chubuense (strain NBB4) TaxID=710421 RepID=I4BE46_MYCCN|nr:SRPBCC family protein [Mycolicibacterium chubuense]AFM15553.1 putative integral membrane protein [Mycolicibacterium chubuense NBB4]
MTQTVKGAPKDAGGAREATPSGPLQSSLQQLAGTVTNRAVSSLSDRLGGTTERLTDYAANGGGKGLLSAVTGLDDVTSPVKSIAKKGLSTAGDKVKDTVSNAAGALFGGKGKGGGGKKLKVTNIVEHIDVGAPVDLVYRQWTEFSEWPKFMKKLEQVEQVSEEKLRWKAQVFWSHRSWESTIVEQVPNDRIVWRSKGDKGYVDGAITFHELAPNLTRVVVVLEYHPQGLFERTGNLWRAQGRRVRLELKHFQRNLMTQTLLHPDDVEGWLGEIHDGEVTEPESGTDDETDASTPDDEDDGSDVSAADDDDDEPERATGQRRTGARRRVGRAGSRRTASTTEGSGRRRTATKSRSQA